MTTESKVEVILINQHKGHEVSYVQVEHHSYDTYWHNNQLMVRADDGELQGVDDSYLFCETCLIRIRPEEMGVKNVNWE